MTEVSIPFKVWACGHDNGTWYLTTTGVDTYCWCGAKAIPYEEYERMKQSEKAVSEKPEEA